MARKVVNLGVAPHGIGGDDNRTAMTKINENFAELYAGGGGGGDGGFTGTAEDIKTLYESNSDTNALTNELLIKLQGIAAEATKNNTDAFLRNRANHTGEQSISTITGLRTELDNLALNSGGGGGGDISNKVDKVLGKSLLLDTEILRLAGMATGATKNQPDEYLLDRKNHFGGIAVADVEGLTPALTNLETSKLGEESLVHIRGESLVHPMSQKGVEDVVGNIRDVLELINNGDYEVGGGGSSPTQPEETRTVRNLVDYVNGQIKVCEFHSIPVCDLYRESGINFNNRNTYMMADNLHFKAIAYQKLAVQTTAFLKQYGGSLDLTGKTVGILGASWTVRPEATSVKDMWESELGVVTTNYGSAGAGFVRSSNRISLQSTAAASHDIYVLWCPSNDARDNAPIGEVDDTSNATQAGGMNIVISALYAKNPEAKILLLTSLKAFTAPYMYDPTVVRT